ncbi:hypothetical protein GCM10023187_03040 [Nibrella viscosa]|uniref:Phage protein n=1 Tax=Nibrella viscosa TaxID=1084524 RepID=A0ABP8JTA7_9BACT
MKIRWFKPNQSALRIETVGELEDYFGRDATPFKYDYYGELDRSGSLKQIDVEAYLIQTSVWFMFEDGDYLIRNEIDSLSKHAA